MKDSDTADRLLRKLRDLVVNELDDDERAMFAALVAPAIAQAFEDEVEVAGFAVTQWSPNVLPDALRVAIRGREIRIEGL